MLLRLVFMFLKFPVKWECAVVFLLFTDLAGKMPFLVTFTLHSL